MDALARAGPERVKWGVHRKARQAIWAGKYQEAIDLYRARLDVEPRDAAALGMIAQCHEWNGDAARALDYAEQYLARHPGNPELLIVAARSAEAAGDGARAYSHACKLRDGAYEHTPDVPRWMLGLLKPLEVLPRFRNVAARVRDGVWAERRRLEKGIEWATRYAAWYESARDGGAEVTLH